MKPDSKQKPINRAKFGVTSRPRIPADEPYTPGLRKPLMTYAIGFHANLRGDDRDDE